ncbi:D-2-hydroxyacid dehydrogenase [Sanyastnella coralliicola]|uniref:D-2-hydroxyacid dehydrogenase n=1 Tax=Sanyastnella coralliicola TaxID=3069118 RepID=UPI0027B8A76F|nr:D-2-hydroxyacid dehydrogenase [Longitalea sp. SCSIO 12813]
MKILANDGISPSGKAKLEAAGFTVVTDTVAQDELEAAINNEGYIGLLVRSATKVRQPLIDACPNLKMIGRGGVGMDNIDVDYARSQGREVFNTPASSSLSVAEMVMTQLFTLARSVYDSNRQMPDNGVSEFKALKKKYGKGSELRGKTLGVIGFGRIGRAVASYALGAGMKVVAYDLYPSDAPIEWHIEGHGTIAIKPNMVSMDELLAQSDFITLHVPKQDGGTAVLGADELAKCKDGVMMVNTARGGSIDEDALIAALDSGKVACAALDVFENEPTPREDLMKHPKLSLTPHIGAATLEAQDRIGLELADKIISITAVANS